MKHHHSPYVFLLLVGAYIGMHIYCASWLGRAFSMTPVAARITRIILLFFAFFSPFTMFLRHKHPIPGLEWLYTTGFFWMGAILIVSSILLLADMAALISNGWLQERGRHNLRMIFLAATAPALIWSLYNGLKTPSIKKIPVEISGLPSELDGIKIAQISDMHIDSSYKLKDFSNIVNAINTQTPDLVIFTGDLVDPGLTCAAELGELTRKLKSRFGLFGVFGNHEYYYGYEKSLACYEQFGIKLLRNASIKAGPLNIIGIGDIVTEGLDDNSGRELLAKHYRGNFTLFLSHQPFMYELLADSGKFLVLSGHTHRGQIFPFHIFTRMVYKYFYGLYRMKDSIFYVTSGAGTWGPPLRLFAPSEIPVFTLQKN